ncbi:MAG: isocitrate dehydrogenase, partial [Bacteroidota bacterium]
MMETNVDNTGQKIVGVDLFFETALIGSEIAEKVKPVLGEGQTLTMISNRGTQVWPTGSVFTECVDHYRVRVEGKMSQKDIYELMSRLSETFYIPSHEVLRVYGEKKGFSLAQGQ